MKLTKKNLIDKVPLGRSFLIEYVKREKTEGGIVLLNGTSAPMVDENFKGYTVLSVGELVEEIEPGDSVMIKDGAFPKAVAYEFKIDGRVVSLISFNEHEVFCINRDVPPVTKYEWLSTTLVEVAAK
jgi:hypothetical protein